MAGNRKRLKNKTEIFLKIRDLLKLEPLMNRESRIFCQKRLLS